VVAAAMAVTAATLALNGGSAFAGVSSWFSPAVVKSDAGHGPQNFIPAKGSDPLVAEAEFGWLPKWAGGAHGVGYESTFESGTITQARGQGPDAPRIVLSLFPKGVTPTLDTFAGQPQRKVDAPPVNGRPAYWVQTNPDPGQNSTGQLQLRWLTASGRWAQIQAYPMKGNDAMQTVLRVAAGVTVQPRQIPLPLQITALPADFTPSYSMLSRPDVDGHGPWDLQLIFNKGDKSYVSLDVKPTPPQPAAQPDGKATQLGTTPPTCTTEHGLQLCASAVNADTMLAQTGGVKGLLAKVKLLGLEANRWTTKVLN
jgi:hypothetical protein